MSRALSAMAALLLVGCTAERRTPTTPCPEPAAPVAAAEPGDPAERFFYAVLRARVAALDALVEDCPGCGDVDDATLGRLAEALDRQIEALREAVTFAARAGLVLGDLETMTEDLATLWGQAGALRQAYDPLVPLGSVGAHLAADVVLTIMDVAEQAREIVEALRAEGGTEGSVGVCREARLAAFDAWAELADVAIRMGHDERGELLGLRITAHGDHELEAEVELVEQHVEVWDGMHQATREALEILASPDARLDGLLPLLERIPVLCEAANIDHDDVSAATRAVIECSTR